MYLFSAAEDPPRKLNNQGEFLIKMTLLSPRLCLLSLLAPWRSCLPLPGLRSPRGGRWHMPLLSLAGPWGPLRALLRPPPIPSSLAAHVDPACSHPLRHSDFYLFYISPPPPRVSCVSGAGWQSGATLPCAGMPGWAGITSVPNRCAAFV